MLTANTKPDQQQWLTLKLWEEMQRTQSTTINEYYQNCKKKLKIK